MPSVSVPCKYPVASRRVIDAGAMGVMVPSVRTVAEAEQANDQIAQFLQIENREAVDNFGRILNLPGIDVTFIGPNDLSSDMGRQRTAAHPDAPAANTHDTPLGKGSSNGAGAAVVLDKGYRATSIMGGIPLTLRVVQGGVSSFRKSLRVAGK